VHDASVKSV